MYQLQLFDFGSEKVLKIFNQKPTCDELQVALGDFSNHANTLLDKGQAVSQTGIWLKLVEIDNE